MEVLDFCGIKSAPVGVFFVDGGHVGVAPDVYEVFERPTVGAWFAHFFSGKGAVYHACFYRFPDGLSEEEMNQQAQDLLRVLQLNFSQE